MPRKSTNFIPSAITSTGRASKGTVQLINSHDRLQFRFQYQGERKKISIGLPDTPANRESCRFLASRLEQDLKTGLFKPDKLDAYRNPQLVKAKSPTPKQSIKTLWKEYTEFKAKDLAVSTIARDYGKIAKRLEQLPNDATSAAQIKTWLLDNYSSEIARRTLVYLNACCEWACEQGKLAENDFLNLRTKIKKAKPQRRDDDGSPKAFSANERDAILEAIKNNEFCNKYSATKHSYYYNFIYFLFHTGCRPEEAIALQWQHIKNDYSLIEFKDAMPSDIKLVDGERFRGSTKTNKPRKFPCNAKLKEFLTNIKPEGAIADNAVFPSASGKYLDSHNITNRVWKPVVNSLADKNLINEYLPLYHTRHTFITLGLDNGMTVQDVARIVGNTPKVIYDSYVAMRKDRSLVVPEF